MLDELDGLIEADMLDALGETSIEIKETNKDELSNASVIEMNEDIDNINIEDFSEDNLNNNLDDALLESNIISKENVNKSDSNRSSTIKTDDLASLLSQLLNNKTIEITVKIKD